MMRAINAENLSAYNYNPLKSVYDEHRFNGHPEAIYNMDQETGVPLKPQPLKRKEKVSYRTSGRNYQITVIGCASAPGRLT